MTSSADRRSLAINQCVALALKAGDRLELVEHREERAATLEASRAQRALVRFVWG